jgi:ADP-dependent NAD(P)H-hydrate dehydratase / NAD(P)H-hydrate epimerase
MKLFTADQMRTLDRRTIEEIGIAGLVLMENAGRGVAELMGLRYAHLCPGPVLIVCGRGNNGGDGYVIARHLHHAGWEVRTLVLCPEGMVSGDAAVNLAILRRCQGEIVFAPDEESLASFLAGCSDVRLVVDALFGTGLSSEIRGHHALVIDWINAAGHPVTAVDIPSGVDATSGRILGRAVQADLTVTLGAAKVGMAVHPGAGMVGELAVLDIGIPPFIEAQECSDILLVEGADAAPLLPARPETGHKGTFGHLLVVAGSTGKMGAAAMTAEGGLRVGSGLVTVACPEGVHAALAAKLTEAMTHPLPGAHYLGAASPGELQMLWQGKDALALGPGMGQAKETFSLIRDLVRSCPLPMVLDADALNALAEDPESLTVRGGAETVLTPHPGEMARLCGRTVAEVEGDRIGIARTFASRFSVVLLLKGARTVVAFPDGRIRINGSGNPGLASGGMGDVLTGLIGGLLAQGLSAEDASVLGVYLHGFAADRLSHSLGTAGMLASDLLREIPATRRALRESFK